MAKLLTFLGTGSYEECCYSYNNQVSISSNYIQICILDILNKSVETNINEIIIFLTKEAEIRNYLANAKYPSKPGLKKQLENYIQNNNINLKITPVKNVPNGNSEEEIWEIFDILMNNIKEDDVIYFDITHSFRFLPMLAFITLNYSRYIKNTHVAGVFYGSIESFCQEKGISIREIEKIPISERIVPIINLTNFIELFDWVIGVKEFMTSLNYSMLDQLSKRGVKNLNREVKEKNDFIINNELRNLSDSIKNLSENILLCRGLNLIKSYKKLKKNLKEIGEKNATKKSLKPFKYIIGKLNSTIECEENDIKNYLKIVELCCNNNLIQQGLTILEESLITYVLEKMKMNMIDLNNRKIPTGIYNKFIKKELEKNDLLFIEKLGEEIFLLIYNIAGIRNDINHCGFRPSAADTQTLKVKLKEFLDQAKEIIENIESK
ncbi:TIGR02221 family CRISPR-associated protein [Thermovenabulum sp.]|uniref:TIGR02221 family CRISPR-associated protein n=1 Tax=Thermovenabulum sp. TaxID=3100335 RepID=UPI003C7D2CB6